MTIFKNGEVIVHGRSDTTLNPGGVRIGSSEIYSAMDSLHEIKNSIAVGWVPPHQSDELIVLFVVLKEENILNEDLIKKIKTAIRTICSPRHVPAYIFKVSGIPFTRSGKIMELTVKAILAGKPLDNRTVLSNPEVLSEYEAIRDNLLSEKRQSLVNKIAPHAKRAFSYTIIFKFKKIGTKIENHSTVSFLVNMTLISKF